MSVEQFWYDRFFRDEYLRFDDHPETDVEAAFISRALDLSFEDRLLDLACGYGRHTIPLADTASVVGLDRSPTMLDAAHERVRLIGTDRTPDFIRGDMRDLPFHDAAFDVVTSLFSSIGYFEDEDENFTVFQNIADVLDSGGRFLVETVNREFIVRHSAPQQIYRPDGLLMVEERSFNPVSGRSHVDVTVVEDGKEQKLWHSIRVYAFTEIQMLLEAAGLRTTQVWGDFQGRPYTCDSEHMIVLAEKL